MPENDTALKNDGKPLTIVFVHGWSVVSTDTYGGLPERLVREAATLGWTVDERHVFLGKYISFHDEVTVDDIARGFEYAVQQELKDVISRGDRFVCITHSTGGPVVRHWWSKFYLTNEGTNPCPMSHLIMLAPANFGSALAQLGKSTLSRIKVWALEGEQPGSGVLDWLELGSPEAWNLNKAWLDTENKDFSATNGVFPFVLTGQSIDRHMYDHVNSYTGEAGSDGVVRAAAANLNCTYVKLTQELIDERNSKLVAGQPQTSPATAFKIVAGRSHSGEKIGILRSVQETGDHPTVDAILRCLLVGSAEEYNALVDAFDVENAETQRREKVDTVDRIFADSHYIIDHFCMVIFRIRDTEGKPIGEYDLKLIAAPKDPRAPVAASADFLPPGFLQDRQRNSRDKGALTFYLNYDLLAGCDPVYADQAKEDLLRNKAAGIALLGLELDPYLSEGFAHFVKAELEASSDLVEQVLKPNQTTMIDIELTRVVHEGVMRLETLENRDTAKGNNFKGTAPGEMIRT